MGLNYKICSKCKEELPATLEYFHKRSDRKIGLQPCCKACRKIIDHERNQRPEVKARTKELQQGESYKEYHRKYEQTDKARQTRKRYGQSKRGKELKRLNNIKYRNDPDKDERRKLLSNRLEIKIPRLRRQREKYYENHESMRLYYNSYYRQPSQRWKARIAKHRRRVLEKKAMGNYTEHELFELYDLQDNRCGYCGIPLKFGVHVEHMTPLFRGGSNAIENILLACPDCNLSKRDKTYDEWFTWLYGDKYENYKSN